MAGSGFEFGEIEELQHLDVRILEDLDRLNLAGLGWVRHRSDRRVGARAGALSSASAAGFDLADSWPSARGRVLVAPV